MAMQNGYTVRKLELEKDRSAIQHICSGVYDGNDYMPACLEHLVIERQALLLVAERPTDSGMQVDGVVGIELRGHMVFLFGLRVLASANKSGLGHLLVGEAVARAHAHYGGVAHVLATITTPNNSAALKILSRHMPYQTATIQLWPAFDTLEAYERSIGWPQVQATRRNTLLATVPGALQMLQSDQQALALVPRWEAATDVGEVEKALLQLRSGRPTSSAHTGVPAQHARPPTPTPPSQPRAAAASTSSWATAQAMDPQLQKLVATVPQPSLPDSLNNWMPYFMDIFPANSAWGKAMVASGSVLLLRGEGGAEQVHGSSSGGSCQYRGMLVLGKSREGRRHTAAMVAHDGDVIHSALLLAHIRYPHFLAFIDRCGSGAPEPGVFGLERPDTASVLGALYGPGADKGRGRGLPLARL